MYQDAKVRSDWVVFRILTWGHPRSMNEWLATHMAQNRNKSCWLTEIYFICSINCDVFSFIFFFSHQFMELIFTMLYTSLRLLSTKQWQRISLSQGKSLQRIYKIFNMTVSNYNFSDFSGRIYLRKGKFCKLTLNKTGSHRPTGWLYELVE